MTFLEEPEADRVPDVDAGALLARVLPGNPPDLAVLDDGAVRLADVDAEERSPDPAGADDGARRGRVDAGGVLPEVAALPPVDVEALDRRRSAPSRGRRSRRGSRGGAGVRGRRDGRGGRGRGLPRTSRAAPRPSPRRRGVDEPLERRGVARGRPSLEGRREATAAISSARAGKASARRSAASRRELSRQAAVFRVSRHPK